MQELIPEFTKYGTHIKINYAFFRAKMGVIAQSDVSGHALAGDFLAAFGLHKSNESLLSGVSLFTGWRMAGVRARQISLALGSLPASFFLSLSFFNFLRRESYWYTALRISLVNSRDISISSFPISLNVLAST